MSLDVPASLLAQETVSDADFIACIRSSLPYAWEVVSEAVAVGEHATPPPSEAERGQLLRALASDSIRGALERHFGRKLAFQNCHKVAAFYGDSPGYREFISPIAQIRNQSPELRDC